MLDTILDLAVDAITEIGEAVITKKLRNKKATADKTVDNPGGKPCTGADESLKSAANRNTP